MDTVGLLAVRLLCVQMWNHTAYIMHSLSNSHENML